MSRPDRESDAPVDGAETEIARRRDEALARLLRTPPKPQEDMKLGKQRRRDGAKSERRPAPESPRLD